MNRFYVFDTEDFSRKYVYDGNDLGYTWDKRQTVFKLWAPMADECKVILYADGHLGGPIKNYSMTYEKTGVWSLVIKGNFNNYYYNYAVRYGNDWDEVTDPYAKATGVNGLRCMILDFEVLNPAGWEEDAKCTRVSFDNAVIYEGHIRDLTINENSGVKNRGLFLGLSEHGTVNSFGMSTVLDYISELGITHLHLLPVNDFENIDEFSPGQKEYNWGYDPKHFSLLEGSYATNPYRGCVRIREFKEMVKAIHDKGMNVVLDVVYNHTYRGVNGDLYRVFPGFYHRTDSNGNLTNGSGCGNELATERYMVRKFVIDSLLFWIKEYHIDGFRIDLMGLYDLETLRCIREELNKIDPSIIIYGEPWCGGETSLDMGTACIKSNVGRYPDGVAAFSDDIRDSIKGDVFYSEFTGFIHGNINCRETLKMGIVGGCEHPGVSAEYFMPGRYVWARNPMQSINYVSAHDNLTLYDKLRSCEPNAPIERITRLIKMCAAIIFTSQGVPFFCEGQEFLRTKNGDHNSYKSGDLVNSIDWNRMNEHKDVIEYYKGLIKLRKKHPAFRMTSAEEIRENLTFIENDNNRVITYVISNNANNDSWRNIAVIINSSDNAETVTLPYSGWSVVIDGETAGSDFIRHIAGNDVEVQENCVTVLVI